MDKNCIISFANSNGYYMDRLARLSNSLKNNFDGDFIAWVGDKSLGSEPHEQNPYNFKIHAFNKAKEAGYKKIMWLDTSVFAVNKVDRIFYDIDNNGFAFQIAGHWLGNWASQESLGYHGINRDEAMGMQCIGNAGLLGLDFSKQKPNEFFEEWTRSYEAGMFKGAWSNINNAMGTDERILGHRHDLTNSSAIINKMGIIDYAYKGDEVLMYGGVFDKVLNDEIVFKAEG